MLPSDFLLACRKKPCTQGEVDVLTHIANEINDRLGQKLCKVKPAQDDIGMDIRVDLHVHSFSDLNRAKTELQMLDREVILAAQ